MATRITDLTEKTTLAGTEEFVVNDSGSDKKITASSIQTFTAPIIEVDGTQVNTGIVTLDFDGTDFTLTESPTDSFDITINDSGIDHDSLTNFVANEHIDWTSTSSNLVTTGTITGAQVNSDNLRLDGNTLSSTNTDGNVEVTPDGTGLFRYDSSEVVSTDNTLTLTNKTIDGANNTLTIDISRDTNLAVTAPIVLTDDTLSLNADLSDLSDVNVDTPADGHVLVYDGTTDNRFENVAISGDATLALNGTLSLATDAVDSITEIASGLKTGSDTTLVTGTAGSNGQLAEWNADGDLVGSATSLGTMASQNANSVDIDGGAIDAVTIGTNSACTELVVDNLNLNGNTLSSSSGDITLSPASGSAIALDTVIEVDGDTISTTSGDLKFNPTGDVNFQNNDFSGCEKMLFNGGAMFWSERVTIADDDVHTFSSRGSVNRGIYMVTTNADNTYQGMFSASSTSTPTDLGSGSNMTYSNASLAGTDGVDGDITISPSGSSTTITIENRSGASRVFVLWSWTTQE